MSWGGVTFSCLATSGPYQIIGDLDLELVYAEAVDHHDMDRLERADCDVVLWLYQVGCEGKA